MVNFITIQCSDNSDSGKCTLGELSEYIAIFIDEELMRGGVLDGSTVRMAIDAYQGGAR